MARLTGAFGDQQVSLRAFPSIEALEGTYDVCFIATKYQQMPSVARAMLPHLREDSLVVSLQNGIVLDLLSQVVGEDRTVGVMIGYGATLLEPNLVEVTAGDEFRIGMPKGHTSGGWKRRKQEIRKWALGGGRRETGRAGRAGTRGEVS